MLENVYSKHLDVTTRYGAVTLIPQFRPGWNVVLQSANVENPTIWTLTGCVFPFIHAIAALVDEIGKVIHSVGNVWNCGCRRAETHGHLG